jgi:hypothetical protein
VNGAADECFGRAMVMAIYRETSNYTANVRPARTLAYDLGQLLTNSQ